MPFPTYAIATEFPSNAVAPRKLHLELASLGLEGFEGVLLDDGHVTIAISPEPDAAGIAQIDAVIAAHDGTPIPTATFLASTKLVETSRDISSSDWELMGGVVTNPGFFDSDLSHLFGRVVGQLEADGEIELRLIEDKEGDEQAMCAPVWTLGPKATPGSFQVNTNVSPREGENAFRLEARLTTATAAKLYFMSLTLLKVV